MITATELAQAAPFIALVLIVVLWGIAVRRRGTSELPVARGVRNGLIVGALIVLVPAVIAGPVLSGQTLIDSRLDLASAVLLGAAIGAIAAVAYVGIGLLIMPIGILGGLGPRWVTAGTWIAVVPLAIAVAVTVFLFSLLM